MPPGQNISQGDWDHHKAEIRRLYLEESKSLAEIKTEMSKKYNFCPSKYQYEAAFKKWNFRKNLTGSDWKFVSHRTEKRKADNKESEVYLNEILIPTKRVKKELDRHFPTCYPQPYNPALSPQTPPDITVRTPRDAAVERSPDPTPPCIAVESPTDIAFPNGVVQPPPDIAFPNRVLQPPHFLAVQTPKNPAISEIRLDTLPWFQFQSFIESQAHVLAQIFHAGKYRVRPPLFSFLGMITSTVWGLDSSLQQDLSPAQLGSVISFMQSISLERNTRDFQLSIRKLLGPFNCDSLTEFLKYMAYLSSNNMLSDDQSDQFLKWVIVTKNHSALEAFFSVKIPTINAFVTCLFESALRIMDLAVLRVLLEAGVDLDHRMRDGRTPLHAAVEGRSMELARILLDEGVDVNIRTRARPGYRSEIGDTALSLAASTGSVEMVQLLLDADANTETPVDIKGCGRIDDVQNFGTALDRAAYVGNVELVRLLLGAGANVDDQAIKRISLGEATVLQNIAAGYDYELSIKFARLLLRAGANANAPTGDSNGALFRAAEGGHAEIVRMLLNAGAVVNRRNVCGTPLMNAAWSGSIETVRLLLDAGADVNAQWDGCQNALECALFEGDNDVGDYDEIVQALLDAGADNRDSAARALCSAVNGGHVKIVKTLLDADDNLDTETICVLHGMARLIGSTATVRVLLNACPDVCALARNSDYNLLVGPAEDDSVEIVRMLLDAGIDPNNPTDPNPLVAAAMCGHDEIVRMLLEAGAEVNARTYSKMYSRATSDIEFSSEDRFDLDYGFTALQAAARNGRFEIVQMLLDAGADVEAPENSPLPWAARTTQDASRRSRLVQALLGAGANVNARDCHDQTTLEVAIRCGHDAIAQDLLDAGADVNAFSPSNGGGTALRAAVKRNNINFVQKLLDAGAKADRVYFPHNSLSNEAASDVVPLAAHEGNIGIVQLLINAGADVNASTEFTIQRGQDGCLTDWETVMRSALVCAAWSGNSKLARVLLAAGANANAGPETGERWTALQAAAYRGSAELVQILLDAGGDINAQPYKRGGRTTLQAAVIKGHTELTLRLIEAGADVNAPAAERGGVTALQGAAIQGHLGIAIALIQAGADPNVLPAKRDGRMALEGAAEYGRLDMVELLLNAGADIGDLMRASELAEENGHFYIVQFLQKFYNIGTLMRTSPFAGS